MVHNRECYVIMIIVKSSNWYYEEKSEIQQSK